MSHNGNKKIPILDLEKFQFSPPGPMGWNYSKYDPAMKSETENLESSVTSSLPEEKSQEDIQLVELPLEMLSYPSTMTETVIEVTDHVEEEKEEINQQEELGEQVEQEDHDHSGETPIEEDFQLEQVLLLEEIEEEIPKTKVTYIKLNLLQHLLGFLPIKR
ncbi:hypothetical protein LC087_01885 [Bacillus carboniphilus]|uniref:Spore coat protein n=1 Tax=Bacillus carboniphilus TaxID=86663 RepID=A0ABY9JZG6_9BACI|nr:hypothetical protein [Bacillus carboniphilus]WLR42995.1 hypothetical protein LC087_01885 [Bacillus carboniphilus]